MYSLSIVLWCLKRGWFKLLRPVMSLVEPCIALLFLCGVDWCDRPVKSFTLILWSWCVWETYQVFWVVLFLLCSPCIVLLYLYKGWLNLMGMSNLLCLSFVLFFLSSFMSVSFLMGEDWSWLNMMGVRDLSNGVVLSFMPSPFWFSSTSVLASLLIFHLLTCNRISRER